MQCSNSQTYAIDILGTKVYKNEEQSFRRCLLYGSLNNRFCEMNIWFVGRGFVFEDFGASLLFVFTPRQTKD